MTSVFNKTNVLTELVKINQDRVQCYRDASYNTTESDLKHLFWSNADESRKNVTDLSKMIWSAPEIYSSSDITKQSEIYQVWLQAKGELTGTSFYHQLTCCESIEMAALKAYMLVDLELFRPHAAELVQRQLHSLRVTYGVLLAYKKSYGKMELILYQ